MTRTHLMDGRRDLDREASSTTGSDEIGLVEDLVGEDELLVHEVRGELRGDIVAKAACRSFTSLSKKFVWALNASMDAW